MTPYFITGNKNKFNEAKLLIPSLEMLALELPELQSDDAEFIIRAKLAEARKHHDGEFIVEDTSLHFKCLNGLPGPLIKWFLHRLGHKGLYDLVSRSGNYGATARTLIGYARSSGDMQFFEGVTEGTIVSPRGKTTFGWDPIFRPAGHEKTYAEMTKKEKNKISHRSKAMKKLSEFLQKSK